MVTRAWAAFVVLSTTNATAAAPASAAPIIAYDVTAGPQAAELQVEAAFPPGTADELTLDRAALSYVAEVTVADGTAWRPAPAHGRFWTASGCQAHGCRVRYRFRLGDAARAIDDVDTAALRAGVTVAPTTTWLLRGRDTDGARFRLTVHAPDGWRFASGLPRPAAGVYDGSWSSDPTAPYAAFGEFVAQSLTVGGGVIDVALAREVAAPAVVAWLKDAAQAIAAFYGRYPVPRLQVIVLPERANMQGKELGGGGGASILLAPDDDPAHGGNDWVATHEMVHVATPDLWRQYLWLTEGLATYVEPIARARAGQLRAETIWADMLRGMPKGLAHETDRGMNGTHDWGRLYWGGALFWLLADVEIRQNSDNRQSLETALRAVLAAGGNTHVAWPVEQLMDTGDRALSRPVLRPLYQKMGMHAMPVDLPALWRKLGVSSRDGGGVTFDDRAPLARVRAGITAAAAGR
ncbi:MAG TPA: hypothetical protein VH374_14965 [Polyangia bacterium]|jgi:predicted metalloprotease with PDZ domain|nr:hypothetical protein [Polyangia bacterium]